MKTDSRWTDPALEVIKRTDPLLYSVMRKSSWEVHIIARGDEVSLLDEILSGEPALLEYIMRAYGVTVPRGVTYLNKPMITASAEEMKVPVADFLADVMVHEFRHHQQGPHYRSEGAALERDAFAESTRFARLLPPSDALIVNASVQTGNRYAAT